MIFFPEKSSQAGQGIVFGQGRGVLALCFFASVPEKAL
jgi:hypothetical protein